MFTKTPGCTGKFVGVSIFDEARVKLYKRAMIK